MWKIINSPIVITLIVVSCLLGYQQIGRGGAAREVRAVYDELLAISEDAKTDLEKKQVIKSFVSEGIAQVKEALSEAAVSSSGESDYEREKRQENDRYFDVKSKIRFSTPRVLEDSQYQNIEKKYVYELTNNSNAHVENLKHTVAFYQAGQIVDAEEEWGSIKLAPGESKVYSKQIRGKVTFDTIKISLDNLTIIELSEG